MNLSLLFSLTLMATPAPADTAAARTFLGSPPDTAVGMPAGRAPEPDFLSTLTVQEASAQLRRRDVLRITGRFGTFVGRAASISPDGFSGWQPAESPSALAPAMPDPLEWSAVRSVEVRRNGAAQGAVRGVLISAGLALAVAGIGQVAHGDLGDSPSLQNFAAILAVPAMAVGAVIGAVIGASTSRWERVYPPR